MQQRLQGVEALDDALGEIPALDADTHHDIGCEAVPLADRGAAGGDIGQKLQPAWRPLDRDGIGRDAADPALQRDRHLFVIDLTLDETIHRLEEILAVVAGVEAQDVGREHVQENLPLPRTDAERLGVRPGDMPEQGDGGLGNFRAHELRQQREVKILDHHHGTVGVRLRRHHLRELLIRKDQ